MYPRLMQFVIGTLAVIALVLVGALALQPTPTLAQVVCDGVDDTATGTGTGSTCDEAKSDALNDAFDEINCPEIVCIYDTRTECQGSGSSFTGTAEVDYSCEPFA